MTMALQNESMHSASTRELEATKYKCEGPIMGI